MRQRIRGLRDGAFAADIPPVKVSGFLWPPRLPATALLALAVGCDALLALLTLLRHDALLTALAAIVGLVSAYGVVAVRRGARDADLRAGLLDRLVRAPTAIALSDFGLDGVLETVVGEALDLTGADAAVVELPDGEELVHRAAAGTAAGHVGFRLPLAGSASGYCLATAEPLVVGDSEHDERVDLAACRRLRALSIVGLPLPPAGRVAGVLKVYSSRPFGVGADEARVLGLLGNAIGTGLARAELLATLSEHARTDALTGLANRRSWDEQLARAIAQATRSNETL